MTETRIMIAGTHRGEINHDKRFPASGGMTRIPDVIGLSDERKVIIECGSTIDVEKLYLFQDLGFGVYIWPYDDLEPYLWSEDVYFCRHCGHKFNHINFMK